MAIRVTSASTNQYVTVTQHADINDADPFTMLVWLKHASSIGTPLLPRIMTKSAFTDLRINSITSTLAYDFRVGQSGALCNYTSTANDVVAGATDFVAATYSSAATPRMHIYRGNLTTIAAELSYSTSTDGSGTRTTESSADMGIGNDLSSLQDNRGYRGDILATAYMKGVALTLPQVKVCQFNLSVWSPKMWGATGFHHIYLSSGTIPDLSGSFHPGTLTNGTAEVANFGVIQMWGGLPIYSPYVVAVTGWGGLLSTKRHRMVYA